MAQTWSRSTSVSHEAASARRVLRVVGGWRCALVADALGAAAPFEQRWSLESPSSSWSQLARSSAAVKVARHGADVVAVNVSLARGGVGPPRAARRRRLALRSRRGCARRGRAVRATVVARVAVVVVVAARAVECGCEGGAAMAQAWSRSTLVSHKTPAARRVLRVVGGWRCALVADALGAAAPFEQRSSPESPSSSWSQLARSSAAVKVARPWRRRGRGRRQSRTRRRRPAACCASSAAGAALSSRMRSARPRRSSNGRRSSRRRRRGRSSRGRVRL